MEEKILDRKTSKSTVKTLAFILAINIMSKLTAWAIYKKNLSVMKNVVNLTREPVLHSLQGFKFDFQNMDDNIIT